MDFDHGPLFASQLDFIRFQNDNYIGGRIRTLNVKGFETQIGPTCGLVGVRIVAIALKADYIPKIDEMLRFCQINQYTKNGECFSGRYFEARNIK
jgi:hypothetical protein